MADDQELMTEFVSESLQGLSSIETDLLALESDGGADRELVNRIFRAVHSIKGTGSYMGLDNLVRLSHLAETVLDQIRTGERTVTPDVTDAVLSAVDALVEMLQSDDIGQTFCNQESTTKLNLVLGNAGPGKATLETIAEKPSSNTNAQAIEEAKKGPAKSSATSVNAKGSSPAKPVCYADVVAADDLELVQDFVSEGLQGLRDIEQDLLVLESDGGSDSELVNRIFRAIHTIKGNAGQLKLDNLVRVSHLAETILDRIRTGEQSPTSQVTDAILGGVDALITMLSTEALGTDFDTTAILHKLQLALDNNNATKAPASNEILTIVTNAWNGRFFVYEIAVNLEHLHSAVDLKEGVVVGLSSVGKILYSTVAVSEIDKTPSGECTIYFETVLEGELLVEHFHLQPANITLLKLQKNKTKATEPSAKAVTTSTVPGPAVAKTDVPKPAAPPHPTQPARVVPPANKGEVLAPAAKAAPDAKKPDNANSANKSATNDQTMRVPVHILHDLLEWTGTMVMARNQLMNEFNFNGNTAFRTLSQAISGVHETVIETRMQTTGSLFERYRRVVRDLARQLEKEVALHIEGGDLELDRSILESFADPLTHLIRNCMDHALETPSEREAAGKNRQGNVYLRSYIQSGEIILEVQDDGRGICANRVCDKAVSKGVITKSEADSMTENEKLMLIFRAGFSTKDQASDVSGRGVGMDVVRNNIESVGGTIDVQTRVGEGSTFAAILPLAKALVSSSLTKALVVELNNEQFVIPETAVSEIIRFDDRVIASIVQVDGQKVFQLRDKLVAIVDLSEALSLNASPGVSSPDLPPKHGSQVESCLVVFQYRKYLFGAVVDIVVGVQEIIVRSTPKLIQNCAVYSGHTVLGTGAVALILDINGLVQKLNLRFSENKPLEVTLKESNSNAVTNPSIKRTASQKMLVFSYAANEYFPIPLELVAIIERISPNDLRMIGDKEYCQLKQETISVMRLDQFLPINKFDPASSDCCLVRAAAVAYPIGILTGPDISIVDVDDSFETRLNDSKGILGTFLHENRLIMLLDIYSVFERHAPEKMNLKQIKTSRARILIAEDSLFFRRLIMQYVQCEDWDIEIFNDGLEAWEMLQQEPLRYQLIISDINMPRMNGFEFATNVRDDRRFDHIPMVALTTLSDEHFREKGLSLGFDRYVIKIDKHQIRQTVAECLNIKRTSTRK